MKSYKPDWWLGLFWLAFVLFLIGIGFTFDGLAVACVVFMFLALGRRLTQEIIEREREL